MTTNSMLSIYPDYERATRYGSVWLQYILRAARDVGLPYVDLYKENATAENFFHSIDVLDPLIVNIFGHGNYNLIVCQDGKLLLEGGVNDEVLAHRVIYDLSCRSGRDLGDSIISNRAISFLGYNEDFVFDVYASLYYDPNSNPLDDDRAQPFFDSHNSAPISFIRGSSISQSYINSQDRFNHWINIWSNSEDPIAPAILQDLVWDRDCQVLKPEDIIEPPPIVPSFKIGPLLLILTPLLIIPALKNFK